MSNGVVVDRVERALYKCVKVFAIFAAGLIGVLTMGVWIYSAFFDPTKKTEYIAKVNQIRASVHMTNILPIDELMTRHRLFYVGVENGSDYNVTRLSYSCTDGITNATVTGRTEGLLSAHSKKAIEISDFPTAVYPGVVKCSPGELDISQ